MCQCLAYTLLFLSVQSSQNRSDCHLTSAASSLAVWFFLTATDRSLLFTHVCPATGFCRCCAFQIGKICCQNCIVRNFQFRKFRTIQLRQILSACAASFKWRETLYVVSGFKVNVFFTFLWQITFSFNFSLIFMWAFYKLFCFFFPIFINFGWYKIFNFLQFC